MLLQCMTIVAKKLRVDADKTTAFVKEIKVSWSVVCNVLNRKTQVKHFAIKIKFCALSNLLFL